MRDDADEYGQGFEDLERLIRGEPANGAAPPDENPRKMRVRIRSLGEYATEQVDYLPEFHGFLPRGMVSALCGEAGLGKSMLATHICVTLARHGLVSCLAVAEDSVAHIVRPRLQAAGMTPDLEHLIKIIELSNDAGDEGQLRLPEDAEALHEALLELSRAGETPAWANIDPIGSFLGRDIDNARDQDVRDALGPLVRIAQEFGTAVTYTAHLNKRDGRTLRERLGASAAFFQLPRAIALLAADPDDPEGELGASRVLASGKLNLDKPPRARRFSIVQTSVEAPRTPTGFRDSSRLEQRGHSDYTCTQLIAHSRNPKHRDTPKRSEAEEFLLEFLSNGPVPHAEVLAEAARRVISTTTLDAAARDVGVQREREGFPGATSWRLT